MDDANEHRPDRRIPFEVAHKASPSSASSLSYTSAEESPQKPCHQPNDTNNQGPGATSSSGRTITADAAPTEVTYGLPTCFPQPLYRFRESTVPSNVGTLNRPAFNNPPVGELLDLGTEPAEDEVEKLEGAIQALHNLVVGKRFVQEHPEGQGEHHLNTSTAENMLGGPEAPKVAVSETPQAQDYTSEDTSKISAQESQTVGDSRAATMGAIVCFECEAIFSTILGLQHHQIRANHNYCHLCNAFFVDGSFLEEHKEVLHNFKCAGCGLRSDSWEGLMAHQKTTGHCFCKACHCYFLDNEDHHKHLASHRSASAGLDSDEQLPAQEVTKYQKGHSCVHCGRVLTDQPGLDQHVRQVHTHNCGTTNCQFSGVSADHLKSHQQRTGHDYCAPCDRFFVDHLGFLSHKKSEKHMKKLKEQNATKA